MFVVASFFGGASEHGEMSGTVRRDHDTRRSTIGRQESLVTFISAGGQPATVNADIICPSAVLLLLYRKVNVVELLPVPGLDPETLT